MPPVRLLIVGASLAGGGAERVTSTLLVHLDRARVTPELCLLRGPTTFAIPDDVAVTILGKERARDVPRTILRLRRLIAERRPDVVLSMIAFVSFVTGAALVGTNAPPWIARVGAPRHSDGVLRPLLTRMYRRRAALVLANSSALVPELARGGARVQHVPNPTDVAAIERAAGPARPHDPPVIVAVGRLSPEKRVELLVEAFARVQRSRACALWLVGDGPERGKLERQIARLGLGDAVRLLGERDPYPVLREATIFALSSEFEGLPNALLEAQALGLPAVATRCGGPTEILDDGVTGLLVPNGDVAAFARALEQLLDDRPRREAMGAAAAARIRARFDTGVIVPAIADAIVRIARASS